MYPVLCLLLYSTQLWATYILHVLSRRPRDGRRKATMAALADRIRSSVSGSGRLSKRYSLAPGLGQEQDLRNAKLELEFDPMYLVENSTMGFMLAPESTMDRVRASMGSYHESEAAGTPVDKMPVRRGGKNAPATLAAEIEEAPNPGRASSVHLHVSSVV